MEHNQNQQDVDMEAILDVMGCKTRRDIMDLLREEPRFVSEISQELQIGQKRSESYHWAFKGYGRCRYFNIFNKKSG